MDSEAQVKEKFDTWYKFAFAVFHKRKSKSFQRYTES